MDPISMFLQSLLSSGGGGMPAPSSPAGGALAASGMQGADTATPGSGTNWANILSSIKAPQAQKPVFSGGVSGAGLPFLQSMPNTLAPALSQSFQRIGGVPTLPSLGQLLAGR